MSKLALYGGPKIRSQYFPGYNTIGNEEMDSVQKVMKSGKLSAFIGGWHPQHFGGEKVQEFERSWSEVFSIKYSVSVNSASSALIIALGAIGIEPGDEVIVTPYSMCISATAPLFYGAIPVFADLDSETFILSYEEIEKKITRRTKAIIIVDIFGQPYEVDRINKLAKDKGLYIIEDASQAPMAKYKNNYAGTFGDLGIFSFNYHKHIHTGEGGMIVTRSKELEERCQYIRNHAEAVIEGSGHENLVNMLGYNMRMGEIEAAIGLEQMKKIDDLISKRLENVQYFEDEIKKFDFVNIYHKNTDITHVYYKHAFRYREDKIGVHRNKFVEALKAELMPFELREEEGISISAGYVKPLYLLPLFQQKIAIGSKGYPFNQAKSEPNYKLGSCPIVEEAHFKSLICHEFIVPSMKKEDIDDVVNAFEKVYDNREALNE